LRKTKSSVTVIGEDGGGQRQTLIIARSGFSATINNKQFNFVRQVSSILKIYGRAAAVVPDNDLFEGGPVN
jgi:type I restriction enzyme M protein